MKTKHDLVLYNSLTRQKEHFKPLKEGEIKMYVCGVTVYDRCHLGHGRSMVCFDVMVRFFRYLGFQVTYVRNITDIDDKIIVRAAERKIPINALTAEQIEYLHADTQALGILPPDIEPCATHSVPQMIALIEQLIMKGYAYVTAQGNVCFEVEKFPEYGQLSKQDLDKLLAGSRIEIDIEKKSPLDFVLWKKAKPEEPAWSSPWGEGRPGWHIECSAMSMDLLGEKFDIHGGGLDLQFPHHENEIAQSEAATGHQYANYWVHVGMLQVNDTKMSKSLGNFFTIEDVLKNHHPEIVRFFLLSSHYRSQLNYSEENLRSSAKALMRLYQALRGFTFSASNVNNELHISNPSSALRAPSPRFRGEGDNDDLDSLWVQRFQDAMADDLNTPIALAVLFQLSHELNKQPSQRLAATLKHLGGILGILQHPAEAFLQAIVTTEEYDPHQIEERIAARNQAREGKNWTQADEIRQELLEKGIELEDTKTGTVWRKILK